MSESETAAGSRQGDTAEDDCPLCLEPLPPFWDTSRRAMAICCGKNFCVDCNNEETVFIEKARAEGTYGRQEEQLNKYCPLCRTRKPARDMIGRVMKDRFDKGQLPLHMYRILGSYFVEGEGGVERNVAKAMEITLIGAEKGDPNCQFSVGDKYHEGTCGLPKSRVEAKRWWLSAAEQGHAVAECNLALMLGEEGDNAKYWRYMRGSASKDYDIACHNLGLAYCKGLNGLQKSAEEAIRVLVPAAERGHARSMGLLGVVMCQPLSALKPKDNPNATKGVHWLRRAAEKGDQIANSQLRAIENWASSICFLCDKKAPSGGTYLRCSRCRAAWYCSKDCQVQHWKAAEGGGGHKQCCIKWK